MGDHESPSEMSGPLGKSIFPSSNMRNGPKVTYAALVKPGCMLETPSIRRYSSRQRGSENASGADNQQERLEPLRLQNPQRLYAEHEE